MAMPNSHDIADFQAQSSQPPNIQDGPNNNKIILFQELPEAIIKTPTYLRDFH